MLVSESVVVAMLLIIMYLLTWLSIILVSSTIAVKFGIGEPSIAPTAIVAHLRTFSTVAASFARTSCRNVTVKPLTAANTVCASSKQVFLAIVSILVRSLPRVD